MGSLLEGPARGAWKGHGLGEQNQQMIDGVCVFFPAQFADTYSILNPVKFIKMKWQWRFKLLNHCFQKAAIFVSGSHFPKSCLTSIC